MTDDQLHTAAFVFLDELRSWKKVKFNWNECVAVRSETHEQASFDSEDKAQEFIERRAASALLRFYHEEQVKAA